MKTDGKILKNWFSWPILSALVFLLGATYGAPALSVAQPADACRVLRTLGADELASLKAAFLQSHNTNYTVELDTPPVRNQCNYGGCWAYSDLAGIEQEIYQKTGKLIDLSEQYVVANDLLSKIDDFFRDPKLKITAGSHIQSAEWIIRNRGIVPASVWRPRIPFENTPHSRRLLFFLNNRIARYHLDAARLAEDSPQRAELLRIARQDVNDIFTTYLGSLPTHFEYEGVNYTPTSFATAEVPVGNQTVIRVFPRRPGVPDRIREPKPAASTKTVASPPETTFVEDFDHIEARIIDSIRAGKAVPFSFEVANEFFDHTTGILSIGAFPVPENFVPLNSRERSFFDLDESHHAAEIVGVDLDENGKIRKLKIRNSWGTKHGDHGFDHMYADYFQHYLSYLFFR